MLGTGIKISRWDMEQMTRLTFPVSKRSCEEKYTASVSRKMFSNTKDLYSSLCWKYQKEWYIKMLRLSLKRAASFKSRVLLHKHETNVPIWKWISTWIQEKLMLSIPKAYLSLHRLFDSKNSRCEWVHVSRTRTLAAGLKCPNRLYSGSSPRPQAPHFVISPPQI